MEKIQLIQNVSAFIEKHALLRHEGKVLVTLSGGADSVALLFVLRQLGVDCVVAHCNFHLRGDESMRDEDFVRMLCKRLDIKCVIQNFDVYAHVAENGISVEMACRELRYSWFEELRKSEGCDAIAVAHHRDDNIETFFLNILRGTGVAGLASIKPKNGFIVRPLLNVTRLEIEDYLAELGEPFIVDSTNAENDFKRNRLRNIILPMLNEQFPDAETGIARTIDNLYTSNEVYQDAIFRRKKEIMSQPIGDAISRIDMSILVDMAGHSAILHEILKDFGYNFAQVEDILRSYESRNSGKSFLSSEYEAILNRAYLDILLIGAKEKNECEEFHLDLNAQNESGQGFKVSIIGNEEFCNIDLKESPINVAYFSDDILNKKIIIRRWRNGDKFIPFGMRGSKKISDLFANKKLSIKEKNDAWLLTADGDIAWVVGLRRSNLCIPPKNARNIVRIEFTMRSKPY